MIASAASDWAQVAVVAILGLVTAYLGLSVSLKARQEMATNVAHWRFPAYAALWAETITAAPMSAAKRPPLTSQELADLYSGLTEWYYKDGNGMLLSQGTRNVYLAAKNNLVCPIDEYLPESLRASIEREPDVRSKAAVRQLSLLRTAMRSDLGIFAGPWGKEIDEADREFLRECRINPRAKPWRTVSRKRKEAPPADE